MTELAFGARTNQPICRNEPLTVRRYGITQIR
jgi:hypothetical protein